MATVWLKHSPTPPLELVVVDHTTAQQLWINRGIPFARTASAAATKVSNWTDGSGTHSAAT